MIKLIGITGAAFSGKDTLYKVLEKILLEKKIEVFRVAFADNLKSSVDKITKEHFGISAFTVNSEEKNLIRPILVEYGRIKRIRSNGRYFVELVKPQVKELIKENYLPIITDCRHCEYAMDEDYFVKEEMGGVIVHVTRIDKYNNPIQPFNVDETLNDPKLYARADYKLVWPTLSDNEMLEHIVRVQLKDLIDKF